MGRVPICCSRDISAERLKSGVTFRLNEPVSALRFSCWVKYCAPGAPDTREPATALLRAVDIAAIVGVTLQVRVAVKLPHSVLNKDDCTAGLIVHTPPGPRENSVRVVPLKMCGVSSNRSCSL